MRKTKQNILKIQNDEKTQKTTILFCQRKNNQFLKIGFFSQHNLVIFQTSEFQSQECKGIKFLSYL